MRAGNSDGLPQPGLVGSKRLGRGRDASEIVGVVNLGGFWIEVVGKLFEPLRGSLDRFVRVSHHDHLLT